MLRKEQHDYMEKASGIWAVLLHSIPNKVVLGGLHFLCIPVSSALCLSCLSPGKLLWLFGFACFFFFFKKDRCDETV